MGLLARFLEGAPPPTRLYLTRAGPVENPRGVLYSHPGPPLADAGRSAFRALAERLAGAELEAVYAADARADAEAAALVAGVLGVGYELRAELRERSWGAWEGLPFAEVQRRWPREVAAWTADEAGFAPPGGESVRAVWARSQPVLKALIERHRAGAFLVVANCTTSRAALALALPFLPPEEGLRIEQNEAELSLLRFYGGAGTLAFLNRP